jgi:hypothetical protein
MGELSRESAACRVVTRRSMPIYRGSNIHTVGSLAIAARFLFASLGPPYRLISRLAVVLGAPRLGHLARSARGRRRRCAALLGRVSVADVPRARPTSPAIPVCAPRARSPPQRRLTSCAGPTAALRKGERRPPATQGQAKGSPIAYADPAPHHDAEVRHARCAVPSCWRARDVLGGIKWQWLVRYLSWHPCPDAPSWIPVGVLALRYAAS